MRNMSEKSKKRPRMVHQLCCIWLNIRENASQSGCTSAGLFFWEWSECMLHQCHLGLVRSAHSQDSAWNYWIRILGGGAKNPCVSELFMLQFKNHKRRFTRLSTGGLGLDSMAQLLLHPAPSLAVSSSFCPLWGSLDTAKNARAADGLTDLRKGERTGCTWKLHNGNKESSLQQSLSSRASWASLGHRTVPKQGPFCYTIYKSKF